MYRPPPISILVIHGKQSAKLSVVKLHLNVLGGLFGNYLHSQKVQKVIKFLTKVTAVISSQNNLIVSIKNGEKLPSSTFCSRCSFRLQTAVTSYYTHPLFLAQFLHSIPPVRHPLWQGVSRVLPPFLWFYLAPSPMALGDKKCQKLVPSRLESGRQQWRKSAQAQSLLMPTQSLVADFPPLPQMVSEHFHKYYRNSSHELVDFLVNLMLFNKHFCGTQRIQAMLT